MTDKAQSSALESAPEHVKLAVDLIYLLESNEIPAETALAAIELVQADLTSKIDTPER